MTGRTETPAYAVLATPVALPVSAATMPAIQVPCPFASVQPFEPSRTLYPGRTTPSRSGCEASTPVSRIATVDEPAMPTLPCS